MTWFAFKGLNDNKAVDLAGIQEKDAVGIGFHGYATEAQAEATPNAVNAVTRYIADTYIADYNAAIKEKAQPGGVNASNPGAQAVQAAAGDLGLPNIGQFFSALTEGNTWLRVAEFGIGAILIIAGAMKLSGNPLSYQSVKSAAKFATKVVK